MVVLLRLPWWRWQQEEEEASSSNCQSSKLNEGSLRVCMGGERVKGKLFEALRSVSVHPLLRLGVSWGGCAEMQAVRRTINYLILVGMRKK